MRVIDDLLASVPDGTTASCVNDVQVGLHWTAVCSHRVGLAATPTDTACCVAIDVEHVGQLHHQPACQLTAGLRSSHPLEVTIGMAALNSLIPVNEADGVELNARDVLLERGRDRTIVTVGHFPFTETLRTVAARLWVLELNPGPGDYHADAAPELIPQADVIGLTSTTLLNGTFESLQKLFPPGALIVMLGPGTPLSKVLFDYGVTMLGGALVTDSESVLRYVGQGSALHRVPGLRRFTMMK